MNNRWTVIPASCLGAVVLLAAGCQVDRGDHMAREEDSDATGTTMVAEAPPEEPPMAPTREMYNWAKLDTVPPPVQRAFWRGHRRAAVTHVEVQPLETGALAYRVSYLDEGGTPGVDLFHEDGRLIEPGERPPLDPTFWVATRSSAHSSAR